jgi:hypothetical protein
VTDALDPRTDSLTARIARLEAIEELKLVKARYFASVDGRDWKTFRAMFTDDCTFSSSASLPNLRGPDDFVEYIRSMLDPGRSLHLGFMPQIEVLGSGRARGTWSMYDRVELETPQRPGWRGFGMYREEYRLEAPGWQICTWHLERWQTERLSPR